MSPYNLSFAEKDRIFMGLSDIQRSDYHNLRPNERDPYLEKTNELNEFKRERKLKREKKEKEMTATTTLSKTMTAAKEEALEATRREGVNAAWEVLKNGLLEMGLEGLSEERAKQTREILNTKLGDILLRIVAGAALEQFGTSTVTGAAVKASDVRIEALTKELRVQGYQSAIHSYMKPLTGVINEALKHMNPLAAAIDDSKDSTDSTEADG